MNDRNRRIVLVERPAGIPEPRHFARDDVPLGALAEGEFLVRNRYLSIDPAQRGWVNAGARYLRNVQLSVLADAIEHVVGNRDVNSSVTGRLFSNERPRFPRAERSVRGS